MQLRMPAGHGLRIMTILTGHDHSGIILGCEVMGHHMAGNESVLKSWVRPLYRRALLLWFRLGTAGKHVYVHPSVGIRGAGRIRLGDEVHVHAGCILEAQPGLGITLADGCRIGPRVLLIADASHAGPVGRITMGRNGYVGPYSILHGDGGLVIGDDALVGPHVAIMSHNHGFSDPDTPIRLQPETYRGIQIGNDVWIGTGAMIMDGSHIGRGAVIAAGAVVTGDIPELAVAAGVPARVIRHRGPSV
ncbi:MAG: acyltransferase [Chloroflexi bacterium]|nr:acyltransferase [Chloroflexota bacterium]